METINKQSINIQYNNWQRCGVTVFVIEPLYFPECLVVCHNSLDVSPFMAPFVWVRSWYLSVLHGLVRAWRTRCNDRSPIKGIFVLHAVSVYCWRWSICRITHNAFSSKIQRFIISNKTFPITFCTFITYYKRLHDQKNRYYDAVIECPNSIQGYRRDLKIYSTKRLQCFKYYLQDFTKNKNTCKVKALLIIRAGFCTVLK